MAEVIHVLTLESFDDITTWRLLKSIYQAPEFKDIKINHCFIDGAKTQNDLYKKIDRSLLEHECHYLMIHDGKEYHRVEQELGPVLKRLKENLPNLKIGIQNRHKIRLQTLQILDEDRNTLSLEKKIFRMKR